jgi:hypothetical protein
MPMLQHSMTARGSSKCELLLGASRGAKHSDHIEFVDKYKINYELMYGSNVSSLHPSIGLSVGRCASLQ